MVIKKIFQQSPTRYYKSSAGFTLLEMLLVVAMIAILAGIVIFAINPGKQLAEARNAQRRSDVNTILNAVYQYIIDNNGTLPTSITSVAQNICVNTPPTADCTSLADLGVLITNQKYLTSFPIDPSGSCGNSASICYSIMKSSNNHVIVAAPYAERGVIISVTK